eukprot:Hpha_TRINITY_DN15377_c2_g5::TRINITY_DN15377_c2_g5_i2::g.88469::m.88469
MAGDKDLANKRKPAYYVDHSLHPGSVLRSALVYPELCKTFDVRPMDPDDVDRESEFFESQTMDERYKRFFVAKQMLSPAELRNFTHIDFSRLNFALVAVDAATDSFAGVGRFDLFSPKTMTVEMAVAVLKKHQGLGLGGYLVEQMFRAAHREGAKRVVATFLMGNQTSMRLFSRAAKVLNAKELCVDPDTGEIEMEAGEVTRWYVLPKELPEEKLRNNTAGVLTAEAQRRVFKIDKSRHPKSRWRFDVRYVHTGMEVHVRPQTPDDERRSEDFVAQLSDEAVTTLEQVSASLLSPQGKRDSETSAKVRRLCHINYRLDFALVAIDRPSDRIVAMARYRRDTELGAAVVVCVTNPEYEKLGLARLLCGQVLRHAAENGIGLAITNVKTPKLEKVRAFMGRVADDTGLTFSNAEEKEGSVTLQYVIPNKISPLINSPDSCPAGRSATPSPSSPSSVPATEPAPPVARILPQSAAQ